MKKFLKKKLGNEKGMTLIELLAVIVILAIIAAIAIPAIGNIIENSRVGAAKSDYINAISAAELYVLDNPTDTDVSLADLTGTTNYLDDVGSLLTFDYDANADTFTGTATAGNVDLDTNAAATKQDVNAISNSDAAAPTGSPLTLTRN
nr:prepilin-type N-terminal cleavage/methylation domain-containing protein [Planomicrobium okeanokoites]